MGLDGHSKSSTGPSMAGRRAREACVSTVTGMAPGKQQHGPQISHYFTAAAAKGFLPLTSAVI